MKRRILSALTAVLLAGSGCTSLLVDVGPGRISATVRFANVDGGCSAPTPAASVWSARSWS